MEQANEFNPVKIILKLDGKEHKLRRFSLEQQLSVAMRYSENKGVEHGIKKLSNILANPENVTLYNETVTEIIYTLLSTEAKIQYPSLCSFRDSVYADAEDLKGSDKVSRMYALTICLNAAIQNSQPVMDEARLQLENENLKKKQIFINQQNQKLKKTLGLQHSSSLQKRGLLERLMNFTH